MKKIILSSLIIFSFVFLSAGSALATSGACSDHLGVDCSAGPGLNGQVQCVDGWQGSSVSYYSMNECMDSAECTPAEYQSLLQSGGVNKDKANVQSDNQQIEAILNQVSSLNSSMEKTVQQRIAQVTKGGGTVDEGQIRINVAYENQDVQTQIDNLMAKMPGLNDNLNSDQFLLNTDQSGIDEYCKRLGKNEFIQAAKDALNSQQTVAQWAAQNKITLPATSPEGSSAHSTLHTTNYAQINNATSSVTASTSTPTSTPRQAKSSRIKHWYDWINPLNWF